jgi:hypothetical protein
MLVDFAKETLSLMPHIKEDQYRNGHAYHPVEWKNNIDRRAEMAVIGKCSFTRADFDLDHN